MVINHWEMLAFVISNPYEWASPSSRGKWGERPQPDDTPERKCQSEQRPPWADGMIPYKVFSHIHISTALKLLFVLVADISQRSWGWDKGDNRPPSTLILFLLLDLAG